MRMRVHGFSMTPFIRDDDVVTVAPLAGGDPCVGEVVAFTLPEGGKLVLHRVISREQAGWLVRGDNRSESDGIVPVAHILGRVTRVERRGRDIAFGMGSTGAGMAWMSRTGGLHGLAGLRKSSGGPRHSPSYALSGSLITESSPRHLVGRVEVEEADPAGNVAVRPPHTVRLEPSPKSYGPWAWSRHGSRSGEEGSWAGSNWSTLKKPDSPWAGQWLSSGRGSDPLQGPGCGGSAGITCDREGLRPHRSAPSLGCRARRQRTCHRPV